VPLMPNLETLYLVGYTQVCRPKHLFINSWILYLDYISYADDYSSEGSNQ
jgi:hypothetical protein